MFKFNKNGNKATALEQQAVVDQPPGASKEQQKSSRRTTSLLNLFMSNSQGKTKTKFIYIQKQAFHTWDEVVQSPTCIILDKICHNKSFCLFLIHQSSASRVSSR